MIGGLARILRRKQVIATLLPDLTTEIVGLVPADWLRYDLQDQGRLWSRSIQPGAEPERPELGAVQRLGSKEKDYTKPIEGGHEACVLLGIGEPSGRLILRRRSGPFDEAEMEKLRAISDVLSLGLRARPFEPPPRPRSPFEEGGPLV